jgi:hypothetical protein
MEEEIFNFLPIHDVFFIHWKKFRTQYSKQMTNYRDLLELYPIVVLASSSKELEKLARILCTIP